MPPQTKKQLANERKNKKRRKKNNFLISFLQFQTSKNKKTSPYSGRVVGRQVDKPLQERWPLEMAETSQSH